MKFNGNIGLNLHGFFNEQKYYSTTVVFLMVHGFCTIVSTQWISGSFNHSINRASLGNYELLGKNRFKSSNSRDK